MSSWNGDADETEAEFSARQARYLREMREDTAHIEQLKRDGGGTYLGHARVLDGIIWMPGGVYVLEARTPQ